MKFSSVASSCTASRDAVLAPGLLQYNPGALVSSLHRYSYTWAALPLLFRPRLDTAPLIARLGNYIYNRTLLETLFYCSV
jgi:hypothetical protein